MPRLVYVDEQEEARNDMERAVFISGYFEARDVAVINPSPDMASTLAEIEDYRPEALITDFRLSEHATGVAYTGLELVQAYQSQRRDFPCFVTTGFPADAAGAAPMLVDVNSIYHKNESFKAPGAQDAPQALPFFLRVIRKIEAHQAYIAHLDATLANLIQAAADGTLSPLDAQRLLDIDDELEEMLGGTSRVPTVIKQQALAPLVAIIDKAQRLIVDLEQIYPDVGGALVD